MSRPGVGNPGNSGGGRKSMKEELADLQQLHDIWKKKRDPNILRKRLRKGKYNAMEAFTAKCLSGDMSALGKLLDKLFANRQIVDQRNTDMGKVDPWDVGDIEPKKKRKAKKKKARPKPSKPKTKPKPKK